MASPSISFPAQSAILIDQLMSAAERVKALSVGATGDDAIGFAVWLEFLEDDAKNVARAAQRTLGPYIKAKKTELEQEKDK